MYVCICQAVTENQIRQAVAEGVRSVDELGARLGVASCCGTCEPHAQDVLSESLSSSAAGLLEATPRVYRPSALPA